MYICRIIYKNITSASHHIHVYSFFENTQERSYLEIRGLQDNFYDRGAKLLNINTYVLFFAPECKQRIYIFSLFTHLRNQSKFHFRSVGKSLHPGV